MSSRFFCEQGLKNIMSSAKILPSFLGVDCLQMALWIFFLFEAQCFQALFTHKASVTTTADDRFCLFVFFVEKKNGGISCDMSARQKISIKCCLSFSEK